MRLRLISPFRYKPDFRAMPTNGGQVQRIEDAVQLGDRTAADEGDCSIELLPECVERVAQLRGTCTSSGVGAISSSVPSTSRKIAMRSRSNFSISAGRLIRLPSDDGVDGSATSISADVVLARVSGIRARFEIEMRTPKGIRLVTAVRRTIVTERQRWRSAGGHISGQCCGGDPHRAAGGRRCLLRASKARRA